MVSMVTVKVIAAFIGGFVRRSEAVIADGAAWSLAAIDAEV
jgi:hypothetical protein